MPSPTLSQHDTQTLSLLLNQPPHIPSSTLIDPTLPSPNPQLQAHERTILHPLNTPSPSPQALTKAITELTSLIDANPTYASAYNNRAQALRLLHGDDLTRKELGASTVWMDLCEAIHYASPSSDEPPRGEDGGKAEVISKVSPFAAKILGAAYTQRGRLLVKLSQRRKEEDEEKGNSLGEGGYDEALLPEMLRGKKAGCLEEMASRDFEWGGKYGCVVGAEMAVRTNFYQKACAGVVGEAMRGERMGMGRGT